MEPVDDLTQVANEANCVTAPSPLTFEQLDQPFGFVLYTKKLNTCGKKLEIKQFKDFAYVTLNKNRVGTLVNSYNGKSVHSLNLHGCKQGDELGILVENQGRQTYETINDYKVRRVWVTV
ncbi:unnamed protein product [Cylicostephanus goldi]|uniref:Beta-galactosidase 1-like first all-beta domain-containing protein n=1 Tax=Cylicostephanus goldi TaxID=71465 RepID=A0A3P7Q7E1_CYLGO|nr:unnamed protein product [Cylicostephanus goldi]